MRAASRPECILLEGAVGVTPENEGTFPSPLTCFFWIFQSITGVSLTSVTVIVVDAEHQMSQMGAVLDLGEG